MPIVNISDMADAESSNQSGSDADSQESEHRVFDAVGAAGGDVANFRERADDEGWSDDTLDDIADFADAIADDGGELVGIYENYRRYSDQNRIVSNYLRSADGDFTSFTGAFYGDSDDPEPGTYNAVQQEARDAKGNLIYYKAMFPAPNEDGWDDDPVLYAERPDDDSHIYVSQEWVAEYDGFGPLVVDGEEIAEVRPPTNAELAAAQSGDSSGASDSDGVAVQYGDTVVELSITPSDFERSDLPFDPCEFKVTEVDAKRHDVDSPETLEAMLLAEASGKDRKTALKLLHRRLKSVRGESGGSESQQATLTGDSGSSGDGDTMTVEIDGREVTGDRDTILALLGDD